MRAFLTVVFCLAMPLAAQNDGIAVSVVRQLPLSADEAGFSIAVLAEPDVTIQQVIEAVRPLELSELDVGGISLQQYGPGPNQVRYAYQFSFSTAYSKLRETNDKIAQLRRTLAAATPALELQLYAIFLGVSEAAREQARQRALPQIIADARTKAQQLATAANLRLGNVTGISEASAAPGAQQPIYGPYGPFGTSALSWTVTMSVRFAVN